MSRSGTETNRILFVKNLRQVEDLRKLLYRDPLTRTSYAVRDDELYDLFGKFGAIRQIRLGDSTKTKGTAFVVYEDVMDAKQACDKLNGFNFQNRYLVVLYHQPDKMVKSQNEIAERQANLEKLKKQHGID